MDLIKHPDGYFHHKTAIIDEGAFIGQGTKIWHWVHVSSGATIGTNCSLGQGVYIGSKVTIGNDVKIQNNVSIYDDVTLEDGVFCGPSMVFTNVINPRATIERKDEYKKTLVMKNSSIGANATIICGNTIGSSAFIAAGAVITKDVKNHSMVAGIPAKHIYWISSGGHRIDFIDDIHGVCSFTGKKYILRDSILEKE